MGQKHSSTKTKKVDSLCEYSEIPTENEPTESKNPVIHVKISKSRQKESTLLECFDVDANHSVLTIKIPCRLRKELVWTTNCGLKIFPPIELEELDEDYQFTSTHEFFPENTDLKKENIREVIVLPPQLFERWINAYYKMTNYLWIICHVNAIYHVHFVENKCVIDVFHPTY